MQEKVYMGNLSSKRDWGHAKDYVRAMYAILQQDEPSDYVIATGITTTIRDFISKAFKEIGVEVIFKGENVNEVAVLNYICLLYTSCPMSVRLHRKWQTSAG